MIVDSKNPTFLLSRSSQTLVVIKQCLRSVTLELGSNINAEG